jgi:hypothetical protein
MHRFLFLCILHVRGSKLAFLPTYNQSDFRGDLQNGTAIKAVNHWNEDVFDALCGNASSIPAPTPATLAGAH